MTSKMGAALVQRAATARPHDRLEVQIFLRRESSLAETPAVQDEAPDRAAVVRQAKEMAERSQGRFLAYIGTSLAQAGAIDEPPRFRTMGRHWINNSLAAEISPNLLPVILDHPQVERVELVPHARLEDLLHNAAQPLPVVDLAQSAAAAKIAWQVGHVNAPRLWDLGLYGEDVLVAVIDSGINYHHPDLVNRLWDGGQFFPRHGFDFEASEPDPRDERGHGTACAGLIAGDGTSGTTTGVAPRATIMALKVGGSEGHAWEAFQFAIDQGADIISMSMGWSEYLKPNRSGWRQACELLLAAGMVFVCSAGKEGYDQELPVPRNIPVPAACPPPWLHPSQKPGGLSSAIACGNTDSADQRDGSSGLGPSAWEVGPFTDYLFQSEGLLKPDLCAPGRGSKTCNWRFGIDPGARPYDDTFGGTSAAAAILAGCIALLVQATKRSQRPVLPSRIQEAIERTAVPIAGQTTKQNHLGSGRVDVFAAYQRGLQKGWWS